MAGLCFALKASNSAQELLLWCDKQKDGELSLTLTGLHDGKSIQIDFNTLSEREAVDLANYIGSRAS